MSLPKAVKLVEVGPRDGLQNEREMIPTADKIAFINQLAETGLRVIEATSFVSPRWIPQLADAKEVYAGIHKKQGVHYPVLVPNVEGLNRAIACDVKEIAVFTTVSEAFSKKNTNASVAESIERIQAIMTVAKAQGLGVRGYLSCVLGCPYAGDISPKQVADLAKTLLDLGCDEISLGDTIGVGTPIKTKALIETVAAVVPIERLAVHFHDTYGQALANIYVALECGVAVIDSAVGGIGGCPYAKGASGNVATEDVLYMLNGMGIETGVDLNKILVVGRHMATLLNRLPQSKVSMALSS